MAIEIDVGLRDDKALRELGAINRSLGTIEKSANSVKSAFTGLTASIGAMVASGLSVALVSSVADEFTNLRNKIALVTDSVVELNKVQSRLLDITAETRSELQSTADLYKTLGTSMKGVKDAGDTLFNAVTTIQKAVSLSGSSVESSKAAIIQLSQALGSGVLRGEELNSVMEQTPRLAKAIADSLGVTIGEMRTLAGNGKLTSDVVFKGILSQSEKINAEFAKMAPTLKQGLLLNAQAAKELFYEFDQGARSTERISRGLESSAKSIRSLAVNASAFGAILNSNVTRGIGNMELLIGPVIGSIKAFAGQIAKAMPRIEFTRTLFGDAGAVLREVDNVFGGAFRKMSQIVRYGFQDLITYDSDLELALKRVKRLMPWNWATGNQSFGLVLKQMFSPKYLYEFGAALSGVYGAIRHNNTSFIVQIGNSQRRLGYFFRDTLRYFGLIPDTLFTFKIGDLDGFLFTMTEMIRGVTGLQLKFYDLGSIITHVFNGAAGNLVWAITDAILAIPSAIAKVLLYIVREMLPKAIRMLKDFARGDFDPSFGFGDAMQSVKDLASSATGSIRDGLSVVFSFAAALLSVKNPFSSWKDSVMQLPHFAAEAISSVLSKLSKMLGNDVFDSAVSGLTAAIKWVKEFADIVIGHFFRIWDEVVGHSWWPDTMDAVVDGASKLLGRVKPYFDKFEKYTINVFKSVFDATKNASGGSFSFSFNGAFDTLKVAFQEAMDKLGPMAGRLLKSVVAGISAVLIWRLFPETKIRAVLTAVFAESAISAGVIFAEQFAGTAFNASAAGELGQSIGRFVGYMLNGIIADIPRFVGILANFVSGLARELLSSIVGVLPLGLGEMFQGIFRTIFKLADALNLGGTLGIVTAILFGVGANNIMRTFGVQIRFITNITSAISRLMTLLNGSAFGTASVLQRVLFGIGGSQVVIAGIVGILTALGAFDSLFGNSEVLKFGVYGLVGYLIFGRGGLGAIFSTLNRQLFTPLALSLRAAFAIPAGTGILAAIVGAVTSIKGLIGIAIALILMMSSAYADTGTAAAKSAEYQKGALSSIVGNISETVAALVEFARVEPLKAFLAAMSVGIAAVAMAKFVGNIISGLLVAKAAISLFVTGSLAEIAMLMRATGVSAAVSGIAATALFLRTQWIFAIAAITDYWTLFVTSAFGQALIARLALVRNMFWGVFASIGASITSLIARFALLTAAVRTSILTMSMYSIAGVAAGGITMMQGGNWDQVLGAATAVVLAIQGIITLINILPAAVTASFVAFSTYVVGAVTAFITGIWALVIGAIAVTGGLLYVMFFGEGDSFMARFKNTFQKVMRSVGLAPSTDGVTMAQDKRNTALGSDNAQFLKENNFKGALDFSKVDFNLMPERDIDAIDSVIAKWKEATERAITELSETGRITDEQRKNVETLRDSLERLRDRAEAKTVANMPKSRKDLEFANQGLNDAWLSKLGLFFDQMQLDIAFALEKSTLKLKRQAQRIGAPGKVGETTDQLNLLNSQRDTIFKAGYRPFSKSESGVIDNAYGVLRAEQINDPALAKKFNEAKAELRLALIERAAKEQTLMAVKGGTYAAPSEDVRKAQARANNAFANLNTVANDVKAYQFREDAVKDFNSELLLVSKNLKTVGLSFEDSALFNINPEDFAGITKLSTELEILYKRLNDFTSASGFKDFEERVAGWREFSAKKLNEETAIKLSGMSRTQDVGGAASQIVQDFEIKGVNSATLRSADLASRLKFKNTAQDIALLKTAAKPEVYGTANMVWPEGTSEEVKRRAQESFSYLKQYIEGKEREFANDVASKSTMAERMAAIAESAGVGFNAQDIQGYSGKSLQKRLSLGERKDSLLKDYEKAKGESDSAGMLRLANQIKAVDTALEMLTPKFRSFSDIIGGIGQDFTIRDMLTTSASTYEKLAASSREMLRINEILGNQRLSLSYEQAVKYAKQLAVEEEKIFKLRLQNRQLTPAGQLQALNNAGANISERQRASIPKADLDLMSRVEGRIFALEQELKDPSSLNLAPSVVANKYQQLQNARDMMKELARGQERYGARQDRITSVFGDLGIDNEVIPQLKESAFNLLDTMAFKIRELEDQIANASPGAAIDLVKQSAVLRKDSTESAKSLVSELNGFQTPKGLSKYATVTRSDLAMVDTKGRSEIENIVAELDLQTANRKAAIANGDEAARIAAQTMIFDMQDKLQEAIRRNTVKRADTNAYAAGVQFVDNVTSSFRNGLMNMLTGKSSPFATLKGIVMSFTENVVNTFVNALTDPLLGKDGAVTTAAKKFVESFFSSISSFMGGSEPNRVPGADTRNAVTLSGIYNKLFSTPDVAKTSDPEQIGVLQSGFESMVSSFRENFPRMAEMINSGLGETFLTGIGGLLVSLDGVFRSIFSVFNSMSAGGGGGGVNWLGIGLQVAGMVGGMMSPAAPAAGAASTAGSGANLATMGGGQGLMLSSGPVSVSSGFSAQTSMIDKDLFSGVKFSRVMAIGGVIPGPLGSPQPIMGHGGELVLNSQQQRALLNGENGGNTQHITLNIQGDVSRQTRSEVMRLIPQIALGVNAQNKEAGSR